MSQGVAPGTGNPYGYQLYTVTTPSGSELHLQTQEEADWYESRRDRYLHDNQFPNISDLQDLDRLLMLEVLSYRWGLWMAQGFDYLYARVDEGQLKNNIKEYSVEIRLLKQNLGIDKSTRDKDKGECHDSLTQVLTLDGWRAFADVQVGDLVATRDECGVLAYEPALAVHEFDYDGDLYVVETNRLNFAVTPNHRMLHMRRGLPRLEAIEEMSARSHNYRLVKTATVESRPSGVAWFAGRPTHLESREGGGPWLVDDDERLRAIYSTSTWATLVREFGRTPAAIRNRAWRLGLQRGAPETFDKSQPLDKVPLVEYARLLGFWIAEGTKSAPGSIQVHFSQSKPEGIAWVDALLERLGWPHRRHGKANGEVRWSIANGELRRAFEACLGADHEIRLPREVFAEWSEDEMRGLLEGLVVGDGHTKNGLPVAYYTTSKRLADDVQRLVAHLGMSGWVHRLYEAGERGASPRANLDAWAVSIRHSRSAIYRPDKVQLRPYVGKVYCLTVPSGTLLTRRNGVVLWSGNSLADYTANLLRRAKEFGYHRNAQYELAVTKFYELRSMVMTFDRCDEEERALLDLSYESIFEWVREKVIEEWDELSEAFRKEQAMWIRKM